MTNNFKKIANEIYILIYTHLQDNKIKNYKEYSEMWGLVIQDRDSAAERKLIRLCPEDIEEDVFKFDDMIKKEKFSDEEKTMLSNFIIACCGVIQYEEIKDKKVDINIDKLYYQAALKQYYIENTLLNDNVSSYKAFANEFKQIGTQIGALYNLLVKENEEEKKSTLASMIKNKTTELFKRYNFSYALPNCCKINE